jgi:hypothetical protein
MSRIRAAVDEERLVAKVPDERVGDHQRSAEPATLVTEGDLGPGGKRPELPRPHRKDEREREKQPARKALTIEHAPILVVTHEPAERRRAAERQELEAFDLGTFELDGGEALRPSRDGASGGARENALDERAAMGLHE